MDSLVEFLSGKYLPKSSLDPQGAYPAIHYGELLTVYSEVIEEIISRTDNKQNMFFSKGGDVLMPNSGETPNALATACCVNQDNVIIGGGTIVMRPNSNKVKGEFLSRYIRFLERKVLQLVTGSTVYHLYSSSLKKLNLFLPKPIEQKKIAGCLSSIDLIIETHERKLHALQDCKKGLLQQLFPREKQAMPQLRFSLLHGEESHARALEDIFITKNGYTPSKQNKKYWKDGTISWFRMDDIRTNGRILSQSLQKISPKAIKSGNVFPANSIIISTSATIGEHALITVPYLCNQRFISLEIKPEYAHALDLKFMFYYCYILGKWCRENINESSFASVNMAGFMKFTFRIPPLSEQKKIAGYLSSLDELILALEQKIYLLQDLKKGLMQQLFPVQ